MGAITEDVFTSHNVPRDLAQKMASDANMALAQNTKSNYKTVKNNIMKCETAMNCVLDIPWDTSKTLKFIAYLLYTREVSTKPVGCQLSGVRMAHMERGIDCQV